MRVAEARGVIIYEAVAAGLKIFEASPPQIKMATTGYGKADKAQMMKMIKMLVKIDADPVRGRGSLRALAASNGTDDEMDAIAIALTAFAHKCG